ncbi:nucleotide exchange factor GrpE [Caldisalinibacter kiritimatiensis]|uniref:Protein GrpE n=1 Tax=Caldisalinibacter kiritimatiensis TaxID=1304284 RepID=R1AVA9_9FIRM|nr:nucleotide exchange factor GrpE [Caldisalinibacter kiritimatiensis]EOD00582.1 Heat shock protein GrpE [Caldisalinibacter kiritimatiensis]
MSEELKNNDLECEENEMKEEVDSNLEAVRDELEEDKEKELEEDYKKMYEEKVKELEKLNSRYLRLQADFTNYKKRAEKEKQSIYSFAAQELISQLLSVIDNFDRALSTEEKDKNDSFYQGVEMVYKQLIDILGKNGLEEIKALGEKFDPNLHHGVAQEESDEHEEGTIIEVFQKGYKLNDKVIRPSMVKISK